MGIEKYYIDKDSLKEFDSKSDQLIELMNKYMKDDNDRRNLIGNNSIDVMYDNHRHHVNFMKSVFVLRDSKMFNEIVEWAYFSYTSRGFDPIYFHTAIPMWIKTIKDTFSEATANQVIPYYNEILNIIEGIDVDKITHEKDHSKVKSSWNKFQKDLYQILIKGDFRLAVKLTETVVSNREDLKSTYYDVLRPVMYEIGLSWEKGLITTAQEHLATSIIIRLMTTLYMKFFGLIDYAKGKFIMSAAQNEFHEVGARMISDLLELDGWDVEYYGANTPVDSLYERLVSDKPDILGISVAMPFNLPKVIEFIERIREDDRLNSMKIMVGGYAVSNMSSKEIIPADLVVGGTEDPIVLAGEWWNKRWTS
ncbi:cobalamin B12-binding domain-containing protein [Alkalibacter saccharofermentans]|uniref:Methanogenic corrinoid protein MtbC1 n=1 Tax=Alkalibacter saccharofermentans DSM 14828 TaxID=1120975 RepID=A0A1M4X853_9FIRM|nr:cobalamin-dependent protein [Alkalibacter saccharofermentans]SHE89603.1 Methanogenic corrinoid protein MtbC1 [Alkalibacter saccharofermentans DSM 14828]